MLLRYLANLTRGRIILWCYLIWYLVVLVRYFDPSLRLWLTSFGLSGIIGCALYISTTSSSTGRTSLDRWQVFRLFLMPFCVSSFSALVKGHNFLLIMSPDPWEDALAVVLCLVFCSAIQILRRSKFAKQPVREE